MTRSRAFVAATLLVAVSSTSLRAQGFDGVSNFLARADGTVIPDALVQYTKGGKMRVAYIGSFGDVLWDGSKWVGLMPDSKQYMIIPNMQAKGIAQVGGAPVGHKSEAVSLGKSSVVAGIKCELWHVKGLASNGTPAEADACLAKNAGFMVGRMTLNEAGRQFEGFGLAYDRARESGMGVVSVAVKGGTIFELSKVTATSLPDSLFVIPAGYTPTTPHGP